MKTISRVIWASVGAILPLAVWAQPADFDDYAKVVRVAPQVRQVNEPRQVCHTEYQRVEREERSAGGAVLGGLAGGLLGSRFGRGDGRVASAAAGAVLGAVVGDRVDNRDSDTRVEERPIRRCSIQDNWVSRNEGFVVDYEYKGHRYSTVTSYDPGDRLPVRVRIEPQL